MKTIKQPHIQKNRDYSLKEIIDLKLIDGVESYPTLYNMVTELVEELPEGVYPRTHRFRVPVKKTTKTHIKPEFRMRPGAYKVSKFTVSGVEIIKFLSLHDLGYEAF